MAERSYNPILDSRTLPYFRLLTPLSPPAPGTALVLVPYDGTPITIRHGERVPDARRGTYQRMFLIDVSEHRLVLSMPLLSSDAGFGFDSRIGLVCWVGEPAEIVARGIRDVSDALSGHMKRLLRQISRDYDIAELHEAEQALNASVRTFTGDLALQLRDVHVELVVDEDEVVASGREFRTINRETRLSGMRRTRHLNMLDERGAEALVAEIVERDGPRAALELLASMETVERAELMKALDTVLKHTDSDREPFDLIEAQRAVLDRVVGGSAVPFGGTRPGRLRGTLAVGELGAGLESAGPDGDALRSKAVSDESPRPPLRAGVVAHSTDAPPEDEPPGGAVGHGDGDPHAGNRSPGGSPRVSRVRGASSPGTHRG